MCDTITLLCNCIPVLVVHKDPLLCQQVPKPRAPIGDGVRNVEKGDVNPF